MGHIDRHAAFADVPATAVTITGNPRTSLHLDLHCHIDGIAGKAPLLTHGRLFNRDQRHWTFGHTVTPHLWRYVTTKLGKSLGTEVTLGGCSVPESVGRAFRPKRRSVSY